MAGDEGRTQDDITILVLSSAKYHIDRFEGYRLKPPPFACKISKQILLRRIWPNRPTFASQKNRGFRFPLRKQEKIYDKDAVDFFLADYRVSNWNRLKDELIRWGDIFETLADKYPLTTSIAY